ncbi:F-box/kelch-repeat protein At3g06240-like [Telopea speciosissima]|uniref:F-box/kelch-repeat protein At3g06240-like n=1 Tax=Telopea speciosissima TaxID=54955 RepID=UPI001CC6936C|nr:F-box/kelch-repeat protein At3g06240-like [Telopea speciosissima]
MGSCNGLLCFSQSRFKIRYRDHIYLLNRGTREFKELSYAPCSNYNAPLVGLGFDPMSKDYKFFKIGYYNRLGDKPTILQTDVWLYSLNSNNWRKFGDIPIPDLYFLDSSTPVVNATIHWMISRKNSLGSLSSSIFSLEVVDEVFRELPQPPEHGCYRDIAVMGGCLSVFYEGGHDSTEIWVMKESSSPNLFSDSLVSFALLLEDDWTP